MSNVDNAGEERMSSRNATVQVTSCKSDLHSTAESPISHERGGKHREKRNANQYRSGQGRTSRGRSYRYHRGRDGEKNDMKGTPSVESLRSKNARFISSGSREKPVHGRGGKREPRKTTQSVRVESLKSRKIQVISSDFNTFHQSCRAARYKVHKNGCTCSKVEKIRTSLADEFERKFSESDASLRNLDGLVVVPETKNIPSVYLCLETNADNNRLNRVENELKLKKEIFGQTASSADIAQPPFKVSCAMCLLEDEPNGFACIASSSSRTVNFVRDLARRRADEKKETGALHADHAHYLCSLPRNILWNFWTKARTRDQKRKAASEILEVMKNQGVPVSSDCRQIEFEHHLRSLLRITDKDPNANTVHWLAIVYDDTIKKKDPCWVLDLPGGKRHLGENSLQGMIRETEEEISLLVNEHWLLEDQPRTGFSKSDWTNVYYMIGPPADILMDEVENDVFWKTGGN